MWSARASWIEGLVVREFSSLASNWRSKETAEHFLAENGIPVAAEIDTRALVRHLRDCGVMRGALNPGAVEKFPNVAAWLRYTNVVVRDPAPSEAFLLSLTEANVVAQLRNLRFAEPASIARRRP